MSKYKIIGAILQSLGCAGAHPSDTLDPPLGISTFMISIFLGSLICCVMFLVLR